MAAVLVADGAVLSHRSAAALWVLAFFSTTTVIHRIRYTYLETERRKLLPTP